MSTSKLQSQRGSTLLGFILGLVIGLTVALGVAMYVTKVPMPFSNKNQSRSAEQDAVESQKKQRLESERRVAKQTHHTRS